MKIEKLKEEKIDSEIKECTFNPKIDAMFLYLFFLIYEVIDYNK